MDQSTDFPVSKLGDRYKMKSRSQVYARINALTEINPDLKTHKFGNKSYVNGAILGLLDAMDRLIFSGYGLEDAAKKVCEGVSTTIQPNVDQTVSAIQQTAVSGLAIASDEKPIISALKTATNAEPFAKYEMLDKVAAGGWHLPSSEISAILGVKNLSGQEFERFGFKFTRMGKAGSESTWKVEKL